MSGLINGTMPLLMHGLCPRCHYLLETEGPNYTGVLCDRCGGTTARYVDRDWLWVYAGDEPEVAAEDLIE